MISRSASLRRDIEVDRHNLIGMRTVTLQVDQRHLGSPVPGPSRRALEVPVILSVLPDSRRERLGVNQRRAARMSAAPCRVLVEQDICCHMMADLAPGAFDLKRQLLGRAADEGQRDREGQKRDQPCWCARRKDRFTGLYRTYAFHSFCISHLDKPCYGFPAIHFFGKSAPANPPASADVLRNCAASPPATRRLTTLHDVQ